MKEEVVMQVKLAKIDHCVRRFYGRTDFLTHNTHIYGPTQARISFYYFVTYSYMQQRESTN